MNAKVVDAWKYNPDPDSLRVLICSRFQEGCYGRLIAWHEWADELLALNGWQHADGAWICPVDHGILP